MTATQIHDQRIELKYILDEELSLAVRQWARGHLGVDGHCSDSDADSYDVSTLYLDTPELDLFYRTGEVGRSKHRIRRYGDEPTLWLETKRKKADVVSKNRTAISEDVCIRRFVDLKNQSPWCGDWFSARIVERRLLPTVQLHYRRFARTSTLGGESLRLTIDSRLQTSPVEGWKVATASDHAGHTRFNESALEILELKFHNQMPHLFKELLRKFAVPATGFSKYRNAVASGMGVESL